MVLAVPIFVIRCVHIDHVGHDEDKGGIERLTCLELLWREVMSWNDNGM